jgi:hypothetical protein
LEAQQLIEKATKDAKVKIDFDKDIYIRGQLWKKTIVFKSPEELLNFFNDNINQFGYNKATAYRYIRDIGMK